MPVTSGQIIARGLTMRCPNCGGRTLFAGVLKANERCPVCGFVFEREEGFFLGAVVINYAFTTFLLIVPLGVAVFMQLISVTVALLLGLAWCVVFPLIFYRLSKSLWLMTYYLFFPRHLPANDPGGSGT